MKLPLGLTVDSVPMFVSVLILVAMTLPVVAATVVYTWHGLRGSDPGPSGQLLLDLVRVITRRSK